MKKNNNIDVTYYIKPFILEKVELLKVIKELEKSIEYKESFINNVIKNIFDEDTKRKLFGDSRNNNNDGFVRYFENINEKEENTKKYLLLFDNGVCFLVLEGIKDDLKDTNNFTLINNKNVSFEDTIKLTNKAFEKNSGIKEIDLEKLLYIYIYVLFQKYSLQSLGKRLQKEKYSLLIAELDFFIDNFWKKEISDFKKTNEIYKTIKEKEKLDNIYLEVQDMFLRLRGFSKVQKAKKINLVIWVVFLILVLVNVYIFMF